MSEAELPQLWELGDCPDFTHEAADLAVAQRAEVGLADRLRGCRGRQVRAELPGGHAVGVLLGVFRDAFLVAEADADRLITFAHVRGIDTARATPVAALGRERGSGLTVCRDWLDRRVVAWSGGPEALTGRLCAVGGDHVEFAADAGVRLVPWAAITWIAAPVD